MSFTESLKTCFAKFATFEGRAQRSEFWYFALFIFIGILLFGYIDSSLWAPSTIAMMPETESFQTGMSFGMVWHPQPITGIFLLATLLPNIAVMVRRLHDTGHSGWWYWIALIPMVGFIVLLIFAVSKGSDGENAYGPDPLA